MPLPDLTLSDFCNMEVVELTDDKGRDIGKASVIFDEHLGHPITLQFMTTSDKSDFEIQEEFYHYYLEIKDNLEKMHP